MDNKPLNKRKLDYTMTGMTSITDFFKRKTTNVISKLPKSH